MRKDILIFLVSLCLFGGCTQPSPPIAVATPTATQVEELKLRMNDAFAGLEMYASDNSMAYPDNLEILIPKYLDAVPIDPVSGQPISYQKTEDGFLLGASGDYSKLEAEAGFPKMNQDGFYVKTAEEFPTFGE